MQIRADQFGKKQQVLELKSSQHNHQLVTPYHYQVGFSEFTLCWVHCLILLVKLHFDTKSKCVHWYMLVLLNQI